MKKSTFWHIWTSYACYYFGKVNLGIIIPALLATYKNMSLYNVGLVSSGFFLAYAIGQFIHGQISERKNPFVYISIGLIVSAALNVFLGFMGSVFSLLLIGETIDGFFQAMGWSSCVKANACIQPPEKREKYATILGTSYQIGNSITWLITAFVVGQWGWRAGFFVAAFAMFLRGITLLMFKPKIELEKCHAIAKQIKTTLSLPIVISGIALCFLNMVRYGVITWIPLYLFQINNYTVKDMGKVGLQIFLIPIFGVLGTFLYNYIKISKTVFASISLLILALSFILFPLTVGWLSILVLCLGSFFLYGTHVFLVCTLPSRMLKDKVVAASTGLIDGMGYIGTISIGIIVPLLVGLLKGNWNYVFWFWALISFLTAILICILDYVLKREVK